MAKVQTVDAYIEAQPETIRPVLQQVRGTIRKALPRAEELISYDIPAYRVAGGVAIFFAGWKKHYSLHPVTAAHLEQLGVVSGPYALNDKGTIRFPLDRPVPATLITRLAKLRAKELAAASKAKAAAAPRKRGASAGTAKKSGPKRTGKAAAGRAPRAPAKKPRTAVRKAARRA